MPLAVQYGVIFVSFQQYLQLFQWQTKSKIFTHGNLLTSGSVADFVRTPMRTQQNILCHIPYNAEQQPAPPTPTPPMGKIDQLNTF